MGTHVEQTTSKILAGQIMSKRYLSTPKRKPPEMAQGSSKCASERGGNAEGSSRHEQSFMDGFQDGFRRGRYLDGFQEGQFMGYRARLRPRYHDEIAYDKHYDDVNDDDDDKVDDDVNEDKDDDDDNNVDDDDEDDNDDDDDDDAKNRTCYTTLNSLYNLEQS